jgi:undecaprenyl-diphosphatase
VKLHAPDPWALGGALGKCLEWDRSCARLLNRAHSRAWLIRFMRAISRLGDGELWCVAVAGFFLFAGLPGERCALHMVIAGGLGVLAHWGLKRRTCRPRPYAACDDMRCCANPLDEYSFPSGHTLHAVSLGIIAIYYFPAAAFAVLPFIALTAVSRVALGLHYPSDVIAGALIGALLAVLSFWMVAP